MKKDSIKKADQLSLFEEEMNTFAKEIGNFNKVVDLMKYKEKKYLEKFYGEIDQIISHFKKQKLK